MMGAREIVGMRLYRMLRDLLPLLRPTHPGSLILDTKPLDDSYREYFFLNFGFLKNRIVAKAEKVMENRISIFEKEIDFGATIDWNRDFVTGNCWPTTPVNYRTSGIGDPKVCVGTKSTTVSPCSRQSVFPNPRLPLC